LTDAVEKGLGTRLHATTAHSAGPISRSTKSKTLTTTGHVSSDHAFRYLASIRDCKACPFKAKCCPNMPHRRIMHDVNEDARDVARSLMGTPEYERSRDQRKKVEMKFAHLKCHHGLERLRLRGPSGARDEFQLAAIVQNLKTLANHI
jgi:hypothetical protein